MQIGDRMSEHVVADSGQVFALAHLAVKRQNGRHPFWSGGEHQNTSFPILSRQKMSTESFEIVGPVALANALRRTVLSSVPSAAIDTVTFRKNSTTFWDECIAHRLGQLPLRGQGSVGSLRICVHNTTPRVQLVTAAALEAVEGDFAAMHPETPLVYLSPDAELDVTCHIRTKTGRDHARFAPRCRRCASATGVTR